MELKYKGKNQEIRKQNWKKEENLRKNLYKYLFFSNWKTYLNKNNVLFKF